MVLSTVFWFAARALTKSISSFCIFVFQKGRITCVILRLSLFLLISMRSKKAVHIIHLEFILMFSRTRNTLYILALLFFFSICDGNTSQSHMMVLWTIFKFAVRALAKSSWQFTIFFFQISNSATRRKANYTWQFPMWFPKNHKRANSTCRFAILYFLWSRKHTIWKLQRVLSFNITRKLYNICQWSDGFAFHHFTTGHVAHDTLWFASCQTPKR